MDDAAPVPRDSGPVPRDPNLRLAGVHLRLGSIALARAELETLAGADALDQDGRIDLVEARWRSGDLSGAGEVARAVLAEGDEPVIALVVAAEAAASLGRPSEARRLASRALELSDGSIDPVFAGMARAAVWPADPSEPVPSPATLFPTERVVLEGPAVADATPEELAAAAQRPAQDEGPGFWEHEEVPLVVAAAEVEPRLDDHPQRDIGSEPTPETEPLFGDQGPADVEPEPTPESRPEPAPEPLVEPHEPVHVAASDDVAARLETGRAAIAAGDPATAALYLGLVVRLAPSLAWSVIDTIGAHDDPALLMVRGDALRAVGRDTEAQDAYTRAMSGR